ncbi:MAG: phosphomannomutase/phosphoglucomutase [Flavobacteriales bacterium]|jgi:phosphomannomutase/phosphoglucomutase
MVATGLFCIVAFAGLGFYLGYSIESKRRRLALNQRMLRPAAAGDDGDGLTDPLFQSKDIFDVKIKKADEKLLGIDDEEEGGEGENDVASDLSLDDDVFELVDEDGGAPKSDFADEVFRAYDIRGIVGEQIDKKFAYALGQAVASGAIDAREDTVLVARDARTHSPELAEWLIRGILSTGCNVINIGTVPTPLMYFALETLNEAKSGVMITASHNPAEYNGFKIVLNGVTRSGDDIKALRHRMIEGEPYKGAGVEHKHEVIDSYIDTIFSDVALAGELTVVVDAANAVPAIIAPRLFEELGCRVIPLYCDLDGSFPNHNPDPSIESNLKDLIAKVKEESADIGIALDGDGDRLVVVSPSGEIIWADRLLMAFSKDIISRNPGADVVFDVKCSRHLASCITNFGGRPVMWKTGHALMKQKMVESGAVVGGEYSGHIFIKDRWFGFDDGMYAAARLLEIMSLQGEDVDTLFSEFPISLTTPEIRISVSESRKFQIIEELIQKGDFGEGRLTLIDGVRVDYANGWGLVRASNTGPAITLRFEADDEKTMHKIKSIFVRELRAIDQSIQVDWNNN